MSDNQKLSQYLKPLPVWAFVLGSSVGWGSFIMSGTMFLPKAGPLGSVIGLVISTLIMILIGKNYQYLMDLYPETGGTYAFARNVLSPDHGFLLAWFISIGYISILWANASALELFSRILLNNVLEFGFHYTIMGFEVYFGEIISISILMIVIGIICVRWKNAAAKIMTVLVIGFLATVIIMSFGTINKEQLTAHPAFVAGVPPLLQISRIVSLAPWAFIGFESISHYGEEFSFRPKKTFRCMTLGLAGGGLIYILLTLISACAVPGPSSGWTDFSARVGSLTGMERIPSFNAVQANMGSTGIALMCAAVLCAVITSFIGNLTASSRLYYAMAKDGILPKWFAKKSRYNTPANAIMFSVLISCVILLLGRTAIEWVVDITTMGGAIAYGWTSYEAMKVARERNDKTERMTGLLGVIISIFFAFNFMFPSVMSAGTLAPETYLILTFWLVSGFLFFTAILRRDKERRYGNSVIVWLGFMILTYIASYNWIRESTRAATSEFVNELVHYYSTQWAQAPSASDIARLNNELSKINQINHTLEINGIMQLVTMLVSIALFFSVYTIMRKREQDFAHELGATKDTMLKDPLTGVKSKHAHMESRVSLNSRIDQGIMTPFAIVICDVNDLKFINDKYGHKAGDEYIRSASAMICKTFKHSPVFRLGGDEFGVLLEGDDYDNREALVEELKQKSIENLRRNAVVVAVGMSEYNRETDKVALMVSERADKLMYENKQQLKQLKKELSRS